MKMNESEGKHKRTWRDTYKNRMLNLRFPSIAAYERVKRAARLTGKSANSLVIDAAMRAAAEILRRPRD
jgi:uncharacterized protein (DUF1778 family)